MLKRRKKSYVAIEVASGKGTIGGGVEGAHNMALALCSAGYDARVVQHNSIGEPDIMFLHAIGIHPDKDLRKIEKRATILRNLYGRIPFVLMCHDFTDFKKFKNAYESTKDFVYDLVLLIEDTPPFWSYVKDHVEAKTYAVVRDPFCFDDKNFKNRSRYKSQIVDTSRLATPKHNELVLELARRIPDRAFTIASRKKGFYWFYNLQHHPDAECVRWMDGFADHPSLYNEGYGFNIDLCIWRSKWGVSGMRAQYTTLHAIDNGAIPIGFDVWKWPEGYDGIWLPSPEKVGAKYQFDSALYAEIVRKAKYDFGMAKENRERMKQVVGHDVIGDQLRSLFRKF